MSAITGQISWVYTEDLGRTVPFYRDVLGLRVDRDAGAAVIFETSADACIGICTAFEGRVVQPEGSMITLLVKDMAAVDAWYARVAAAGAVPKGPPERRERFGIYSFFVPDPNGYVIEVQTFL